MIMTNLEMIKNKTKENKNEISLIIFLVMSLA